MININFINKIIYKEKTYPFNKKGLNKIIKDNKEDKHIKITNISIFVIIALLFYRNIVSQDWLIKYISCTLTSKIIKFLIN